MRAAGQHTPGGQPRPAGQQVDVRLPDSEQGWASAHYERVAAAGQSLRAVAVAVQLRWLVRPWMHPRLPVGLQRAVAGLLRWTLPQAQGVQTQRIERAGLRCDWHSPAALGDLGATIVYFHGGGYTLCSPDTHRSLARLLAGDTGMPVCVPAYRLAPEHPFPAALDDAQALVTALERTGRDVRQMVFAGDSAGAHLALSLAIARRDQGLPLPRSLVLISPCVDWSLCQLPDDGRDALLAPAWVRWSRDRYFVPPHHAGQPAVSPIHARLHKLPPVLIQSATRELFARDARRLYHRLAQAGVLVTWQEWQGLWHDFQLHAAIVPEGRDALRRIARFIRAFQ